MTSEQLVSDLKCAIHDRAIEGVAAQLAKPSGRKPTPKSLELSAWFCDLDDEQKSHVLSVVALGVHAALFGILCAIDGVTKVTDGDLALEVVTSGQRSRFPSDTDEFLHDLYQAQVFDETFGPVA